MTSPANTPLPPLATDVMVRCYSVPDATDKEQSQQRDGKRLVKEPTALDTGIRELGWPWEGYCLVFDTETTTDMRQALRFGTYVVYGQDRTERKLTYFAVQDGDMTPEDARLAFDTPHERGIFINRAELSEAEVATITAYAEHHSLTVLDVATFVTDVFYRYAYKYQALVIGHNLPFDISRLATPPTVPRVPSGAGHDRAVPAGTPRVQRGKGTYRGGFSLKLCDCKGNKHGNCLYHPAVRIKMIGAKKAFFAFQKVSESIKARVNGQKVKHYQPAYTGRFLDTATLGLALLGPGDASLKGMGRRFKATIRKSSSDEHGGVVTATYLDYAMQDVLATWSLYQAERELYRQHGVKQDIWRVYSEASLGKAYWQALGVPPFLQAHPDFSPEVIGYALTAYYGGRSECHHRLSPVEVVYTDFKSQYPTVNALLRLQDILLANKVTVQDVTQTTRDWLSQGADSLQQDMLDPANWPRLRVLCQIQPDCDILPVRARYPTKEDNQGESAIGLNYLTAQGSWYTLADVIASTLLTGKSPSIMRAIEIVPSGEPVVTHRVTLFGDGRYTIDLAHDDFFTSVINLRTEVKQAMKQARQVGNHAEGEYLDGLQVALKLLANSTAYGSLMEVNTDEPDERAHGVTVYGYQVTHSESVVIERPGSYFAGPLGTFITAGGRLLLALAEKLARDRGISYAMCDTDSMAFARPDGMARDVFQANVQGVIDAFTPLSPYTGKPPILEREDVNEWQGASEPLFCIAVSAKRYALYNRLDDGTPRIRKFTSHGLGTWQLQDVAHGGGFSLPDNMPSPCTPGRDGQPSSETLGGPLWSYALWYDFVRAMEAGEVAPDEHGAPRYIPHADWLQTPAFYQGKLSTWNLYAHMRKVWPNALPFTFYTVLPRLEAGHIWSRTTRGATTALFYLATATLTNLGVTMSYEALAARRAAYEGLENKAFIAPYARYAGSLHDVRLTDNPERVVTDIEHKTMAECLRAYFWHPESKTAAPYGVGYLPRRHVIASSTTFIGKETNRTALLQVDEQGTPDAVVIGMQSMPVAYPYAHEDNSQAIPDAVKIIKQRMKQGGLSVRELARSIEKPQRTVQDAVSGAVTLLPEMQRAIHAELTRRETPGETPGV